MLQNISGSLPHAAAAQSIPVLISRDWQIVVLVSYVPETLSAMDFSVMSHILTSAL